MLDAALSSWPYDPWLLAGLLATAGAYLRGWGIYRRHDPDRWTISKPISFVGGLTTVYIALSSPIEPFASLLLWLHMLQHLLLMMLAPPLLWLGSPLLPLVRGLPRPMRSLWVAPLFQWKPLRSLMGKLTHPVSALIALLLISWLWHSPFLYELALQSSVWHYVQHLCFLAAGLLFWFPVVRPYPFVPRWPLAWLFPLLLLADVSNTILSALLTFSDRVIYPHYERVPRLGLSALDDQAAAGVLMWVPGSVVFLLPLAAIGLRFLRGQDHRPKHKLSKLRIPLTLAAEPRFDLLRVAAIGMFLKWRHGRTALQFPLFVLAVLVVIDGFTGSPAAPMNLAGVLPWIHWRGLLILTLLLAGNFFCTACPFTLPRALMRRWLPQGRSWPRRLRSKWLALALVILFFTAYEAFSLWDSPRLTAAIIVGYFAAAFSVDTLFRDGSFCKYVCPIGQFNFVQSLASPLTLSVRDPQVCRRCTTKDCLSACDLDLVVPKKRDNLDCTLCLDCVHACPHDNLGLHAERGLPPSMRLDVAALIVVLSFAAFANAAGMVGPVLDTQVSVQRSLGVSRLGVVVAFNLLAMVLLPALVLFAARRSPRSALCLLPLGFAMWLAHYGFHLATSYQTAWPVLQQFLGLGRPEWSCSCCRDVGAWLLKTELVILDVGLLASLYLAWKQQASSRAFAVWSLLIVALFALGIWLLLQPMDMRGTISQ